MPSCPVSSISGNTSNTAVKLIASPLGALWLSILGVPTGRSFCSVMASIQLSRITSVTTSSRTWAPYCWRTTLSGALPGRKPLILARRPMSCSRLSTSPSILSAGTSTVMRRSRPSVDSTETVTMSFLFNQTCEAGAKGETRTLTGDQPHRDLNPARLPVPPLSRMRRYRRIRPAPDKPESITELPTVPNGGEPSERPKEKGHCLATVPPVLVGRVGIEPTTCGLRVRCSAN